MIALPAEHRWATLDDATAMAELVNMAGEGMPLYLWERAAAASLRRGLSLIVSDANTGARRLYERLGYTERATRPMLKESWENDGENWVLMVRQLKRAGR